MLTNLTQLEARLGLDPGTLIVVGIFFGLLLVFISFFRILRERSRLRTIQGGPADENASLSLFAAPDIDPGRLAKAFLPSKQRERNKVRRDLLHAGFSRPDAVLWFYALRVAAGLVLPAVVALTFLYREFLPLPEFVNDRMGRVAEKDLLLIFALMILVGFYGPAVWLSTHAKERQRKVELGFPNALDLLQVSIESGLGFDAALSRVSSELQAAAPEIATEFTVAQQEILAGRDREEAYHAMAERLVIDEAYAFVNVVLQSVRFGTSMSQALLTYSSDMRQRRELRAQEKANRLPVLMSAVMATLMMPTLLIVTIGPVVLRYMQTFP